MMTTSHSLRRLAAVVAAAVVFGSSSYAAVIYDNTSTNAIPRSYFAGNGIEFGDEIVVAGSDRLVTDFSFDYFLSSNASGNETAQVFFRLNNGENGAPNTAIFDSGVFTLETSASGYNFVEGTGLSISLPSAQVTWSLVVSGIEEGEDFGLILNGPPSVGQSFLDFWQQTDGTWTTFLVDDGATHGSFSARISAIPEPSTIAYSVLGGLALAGWLRSRRRVS